MIIQALSDRRMKAKEYKPKIIPDTIVTSFKDEEEYSENGQTKTVKKVPVRVNLTKKICATAKTIKKESVADIERKLDEVFEVKKAELEKSLATEKARLKKEIK